MIADYAKKMSTYGLAYNEYSGAFVHTLTLDELFQ